MYSLKDKRTFDWLIDFDYHKIASSNTSRLEAHVGFFRLLKIKIFSIGSSILDVFS